MEMLKHADDTERDLCWRGWPYKDDDDDDDDSPPSSPPPLVL